jgi:flagellar hook assembly protein FlgD
MKKIIGFSTILFILIIITFLYSEPSFNGTDPGCEGDGCHSFNSGLVSAVPQGDLQIEVTVNNVDQGDKVAGELVDSDGNVVDVIQPTESNPFTLTAPSADTYLVNAGSKKPSRDWDSVSVTLTVSSIEGTQDGRVPNKIELLGNHPNPFNNITLIKFSLPKQSQIMLLVYNINGQLIRHLADGLYSGGIHQIMWNGKDDTGRIVASGTYLYQLVSENQKFSRKLILSK